MAYPDLQTMFNNGMGSYASMQIGQQQAEAQQEQAAKAKMQAQLLQEQMLKNQQSQAMNPLDGMFRQGQVDTQAAQLPGVQANSAKLQSEAAVQTGTQAMQIAQKISAGAAQIGKDGMEQMGQDAQKFVSASALLRQVPPMQRPQALKDIAKQYGVQPDSPFLQGFAQTPPDQLPDALENMGKGMALASEDFVKKQALAKQHQNAEAAQAAAANASHERAAKYSADSSAGASRYATDARERAATAAAEARKAMAAAKPQKPADVAAAILKIPESERTPQEQEILAGAQKYEFGKAAAGANPIPGQILGMSTPQQLAAGSGQSPQTTPAPVGGDAQLAQALKAQGRPYEPDKYMYRVGPNGQIQRKAK